MVWGRPVLVLVTVMTASWPMVVGLAMYLPAPLGVSVPLVIEAEILFRGTPGTLMLMGLGYPL